ncbi:MAG: hypothetical protein V5A48_07445 [Salinivenus sp.]
MRFLSALACTLLLLACSVQAQSPPEPETQVDAAVRAAPAPMRDAATVLGYDDNMQLTTLREGDGTMVCLADDPAEENFHVACYHEALEPFMRRGRELRRQGRSGAAVDSIRRAEIEDGTLDYPDRPTALYNLSGPAGAYDAAADTVRDGSHLRVLYVPYETAETTGLPTKPEGGPWLMAPGKPWAHVMIPQE